MSLQKLLDLRREVLFYSLLTLPTHLQGWQQVDETDKDYVRDCTCIFIR